MLLFISNNLFVFKPLYIFYTPGGSPAEWSCTYSYNRFYHIYQSAHIYIYIYIIIYIYILIRLASGRWRKGAERASSKQAMPATCVRAWRERGRAACSARPREREQRTRNGMSPLLYGCQFICRYA